MVSRVALLPTRGDPFTLMLCFHFFEKVWQDEVNRLFILLNSPEEKEVIEFIRKTVTRNPKVVFRYVDHPIDHGPALTEIFKVSNEDIVVFIEADSIIFKKGIVDKYCRLVEAGTYDCVGSPRWCCSNEIVDRMKNLFHLTDIEYPIGANYWPCFFFARRKDLEKTDLNFAGKNFPAGEYIPQLQWTPQVPVCGDTFVWMSIQLRALGLKFLGVEQYHGNAWDFNAYAMKQALFDGTCPWLHNGTLDSAIEDIFTDDKDIPLARRFEDGALPCIPTKMSVIKEEMERRLSWCLLSVNYFWNDCHEIAEFRDLYKKAIEKYIKRFNLDMLRIMHSMGIYRELIGI